MDILQGTVSALAFGGQGIVRHHDLVVFIPFTAIGDQITFRIIQKKKSYAYGELISLLTPGPGRVQPPCPYYGRCGGCQLQHLSYQKQLDYKTQSVVDALTRIAKLNVEVLPTVPSEKQLGYRRHITLNINPKEHSAGYFTIDNQTIIPIRQCPIFEEAKHTLIPLVQTLVKELNMPGKVSLFKAHLGKYVLHFQLLHTPQNTSFFEKTVLLNPQVQGIALTSPSKKEDFGITTLHTEIDGRQFTFSPRTFIQNHPDQSARIYRQICQIASQANVGKVLDLYCGVGISSVLLALQGLSVMGVDANPIAIDFANKNATDNNCSQIHFERADVQKTLSSSQEKADLILLNPPRVGLHPQIIQDLISLAPRNIVYISCMPSTLARDLKGLCANHYSLKICQPFDMFPQTAHVETLVHLQRL